MIYILIFVWVNAHSDSSAAAASSIEFNDLPACQAAAAEIRKQVKANMSWTEVPILMCAAKGKKGAAA